MSLLVRTKSIASRIRISGTVVDESIGSMHIASAMLPWGSITKTVTARIAEILDRQGTLHLETPVSEVLPESNLLPEVTIASLAAHTSGIPRLPRDMHPGQPDWDDPYARYTDEYFDSVTIPSLSAELSSKHATRLGTYAYSNLGYAVLSRALEVAADADWAELAQTHVFDPAGITDVSATPPDSTTPEVRSWTGKVRQQWMHSGPFVGAGALRSTFDALEAYGMATAARVRAGDVPFGWENGKRTWWHNGAVRDHGAMLAVSHDQRRVFTVHTIGHGAGRSTRVLRRLTRRHP